MLRLVTLLGLLSTTSGAVVFTCTNGDITGPGNGNLPVGATDPTIIPTGTNCTYSFTVSNGNVLQLKLSALFKSTLDTVTVIDNLGKPRILSHEPTQINDALLYIASGSAQIRVIGSTGTSTFLAKYQYISLDTYKQAKMKTGQFIALSSLTANTYYTITSDKQDQVIATVAQRNSQVVDTVLQNIYVYDGDNIKTATMIGRLSDLGFQNTQASKGSSLTLMNFYGTRSTSYLVANDASAVKNFRKYTAVYTSLGSSVSGSLTDGTDYGSGYTFICTDCKQFYFTQLQFDSMRTYNNGYVTIQGLSPTHGMNKLLNYSRMTTTNKYFPQYIPTNMFTMTVKMSGVNIKTLATNDYPQWKVPSDGRHGYIFSPSLWDSSNTNSFSLEIRNDSTLYNYQLSLDKLNFASNQDKLTLQIGPQTGSPSVNNQYPRDSSATGKVSGKGNYMKLDYSGAASSDVRLSFVMTVSSVESVGFLMSLVITMFYLL